MSLFEHIRLMDEKGLSAFLTMFMICVAKATGIETEGIEIDMEREALFEWITSPIDDETKNAIEMCKETNKLLS